MVKCADLREQVSESRWLQVPNSRLVVNPWDVTQPPAYPTPREFIWAQPLDLGYWIGEAPVRLPVFWSWRPWEPRVKCAPRLPEPEQSLEGVLWVSAGVSVITGDKGIELTISGENNYGEATSEVTVNLDETPCLHIRHINPDGAMWAVKVNSGSGEEDTLIIRENDRMGWFVADIRSITGWTGTKTFSLKLFAVGQPGSSVGLTGLKFTSSDGPTTLETQWSPDRIAQTVGFDRFDAAYRVTTCLPDENTVAQLLKVDRPGLGRVIIKGQFPEGKASAHEDKKSITIAGDRFHVVIAFSRVPRIVAISPSEARPGAWGQWAATFDELDSGSEIVVAATFTPTSDGAEETARSAMRFAHPHAFRNALDSRESDWNARLAKVPAPADFSLHILKDRDVAAEDLERMYYKAWVFSIGNSLPPLPENEYPYPQITCGKPSLWPEGHPKAAASAQWESFVAMQMMAWVDPDLAWSSFEGMMSLVDDEGTLGGEGLPSRHVQTAWVLYSLTGDVDRLRGIYPAMKRLLIWKVSDPRWIFKGLTPPGYKDAEFVVHALMDMGWAMRICDVLDMPEDKAYWKDQTDQLSENYRQWFWETPGGSPYFTYHSEQGRKAGDRHSWTLQGLALPEWVLGEPQKQSLLELFRSMVDKNVPFLVRGLNKFPQVNYAMAGLWTYGKPEEVQAMAEASMTAVTMAGEFAECYGDKFPATIWGVAPSMFGAASMIDGALWQNGIMLGDGLPVIVHTPYAEGVRNLTWKGRTLNVEFDGDRVEFSGDALPHLAMPDGFTGSGPEHWTGTLAVGKQITLTERS